MMEATSVLLLATALIIDPTSALQCFSCTGRVRDCEDKQSSTNCGHQPYCFVMQDRKSDFTVQRCTGDPRDCPNIVAYNANRPVEQLCCLSNNCNCVGRQCGRLIVGQPLPRERVATADWQWDSREIMRQPGLYAQQPGAGVRPVALGTQEPLLRQQQVQPVAAQAPPVYVVVPAQQ